MNSGREDESEGEDDIMVCGRLDIETTKGAAG